MCCRGMNQCVIDAGMHVGGMKKKKPPEAAASLMFDDTIKCFFQLVGIGVCLEPPFVDLLVIDFFDTEACGLCFKTFAYERFFQLSYEKVTVRCRDVIVDDGVCW